MCEHYYFCNAYTDEVPIVTINYDYITPDLDTIKGLWIRSRHPVSPQFTVGSVVDLDAEVLLLEKRWRGRFLITDIVGLDLRIKPCRGKIFVADPPRHACDQGAAFGYTARGCLRLVGCETPLPRPF